MNGGSSFERYPGPPRRDDASYRVISPWRDALAWVSIAGPLEVTRYLVRDGDGWRDVLPDPLDLATDDVPPWRLERRDPVELVFASVLPGAAVVATVTVTRERCELHIEGGIEPACLGELVVWAPGATVERDDAGVWVRLGGA